jgi:hypothetical protein
MADGSITNNDEYLSYQNRVQNIDEIRKDMIGELSSRGDLPVSTGGMGLTGLKSEAADSRAIGSTEKQSNSAVGGFKNQQQMANRGMVDNRSKSKTKGRGQMMNNGQLAQQAADGNFVKSKQMMFGQDKRLQPSEISQTQKEMHKQEGQFVLPGRPAGLPQFQRTPVLLMHSDESRRLS